MFFVCVCFFGSFMLSHSTKYLLVYWVSPSAFIFYNLIKLVSCFQFLPMTFNLSFNIFLLQRTTSMSMTFSPSNRSLGCLKLKEPPCLPVTCRWAAELFMQSFPCTENIFAVRFRVCHGFQALKCSRYYCLFILFFFICKFGWFVVPAKLQSQTDVVITMYFGSYFPIMTSQICTSDFFFPSQQISQGEERLRMCVAVKKKLQLYYWKDREFHELEVKYICDSLPCCPWVFWLTETS